MMLMTLATFRKTKYAVTVPSAVDGLPSQKTLQYVHRLPEWSVMTWMK
jgi:hypothetical protein